MSKNDMVRVPLELLKRAIDQLSVCSGPGPANHAQELRAMLDTPARQHQGEPVALPKMADHKSEDRSNPAFCEDEDFACGWNACLDEIAKLGPLYTHADPAEVERLREELDAYEHGSSVEASEADNLRKQMAEAHALLSGSSVILKSAIKGLEKFNEDMPLRWCGYLDDALGGLRYQADQIDAALTASAEPSAPKYKTCHDQGEVFVRKGDVHYGMQTEPEPIMAACPDCVEPSAPVERDDPCKWSDRQILEFLGVALRNVDLQGEVRLSEIRQGFEYMRDRAALERKP